MIKFIGLYDLIYLLTNICQMTAPGWTTTHFKDESMNKRVIRSLVSLGLCESVTDPLHSIHHVSSSHVLQKSILALRTEGMHEAAGLSLGFLSS